MITVEIFGGKEDGSTVQVSEQTLMSGKMHRPVAYIPEAFKPAPDIPESVRDSHEVWLFIKMNTVNGQKVKLVKESVFRKFQA